jgi:putative ABC transport system substrate-binding protein
VRRHVAVIQASSYPATLAARAATTTIPIVFTVGGDPVKDGLVASLNRPGGNLTGVSLFFRELLAKRRELLRELAPGAAVIGVLLNPNNPNADARSADMQASASAVAQHIDILNAGTDSEIDGAFAAFAQRGVGALLVGDDPLFQGRRSQLAALAARHRTPLSSAELRWDNWHI